LFYTGGSVVRNRVGGFMGGGLAGGGSSTMAALIAPYVGNANKYYVFTTDGITTSGAWRGLCYAVVDMSIGANGSLVGAPNTQLVDTTCEKVTCAMHANGIDFWVITRKHFTNDWYAFLVDCNGPQAATPVITSIGTSGNGPGYLKTSLDGKIIINAAANLEIFDFNNATGVLSNFRTISNAPNGYYGVSMSPNDSLIYATSTSLYRYERFAANINATETSFPMTGTFGGGTIQLASDKKIYCSASSANAISALSTPNSLAGPTFVLNAVPLIGSGVYGGLPCVFDQRYFGPKPQIAGLDTSICKGNAITIGAASYPGMTYQWKPAIGLSNTAIANPVASPTVTSNFMLIAYNTCDTVFDTITVVVDTLPVLQATNSFSVCGGNIVSLSASGATNFSWSPATGLSSTTGNNINASPTITTGYSITGTDGNGCSSIKTLTISVNDPPTLLSSANPTICTGGNISLSVNGANTYNWSPATGLSSSTGGNVTASPVITTTYSIAGINTVGCSDTAYIIVTVNNNVVVTASANTAICQGGNVILTSGGATSYNWNPSTGLSATSGASVTASPNAPATYTLIGSNPGGCADTAYINVAVNSLPIIASSADTTICSGNSVSLSASGANNYLWTPVTGLSSSTGSSVSAQPSSPQSYTVVGTNGNNCSSTAVLTVGVNPLPVINVLGIISICRGDSTTLSASGGMSYQWSPASGLNSSTGSIVMFNLTSNTSYTVTSVDANGCSNISSVTITVDSIANAHIYPAGPFCENGTELPIGLGAVDPGGTWSGTGIVSASSGRFSPSIAGPGIHKIIYSINGNCGDIDSINIIVYAKPGADAGTNIIILQGASVTLSASGGSGYSWIPSSGLSCDTCQNPVATPTGTTMYYVTVTDDNGCTNLDSILITVDIICGELYVPTAFSPNGDAQNDVYYIKGNNCIQSLRFTIYDRWGEIVFETTDPAIGWDGVYNTKQLDAAVFTYRMDALLINGEQVVKKGNVTLVK